MSLNFRYQLVPTGHLLVPLGGRSVRPRPVISTTLIGPTGTRPYEALVDSGADDTIFPEWMALRIGVDLTNAPTGIGLGVGGTVQTLRYAQVTLRLVDNHEQREWTAWVGFTSARYRYALLGFAGCLQYFTTTLHGDREELEMTVNALYQGT